ncbi:FAD-binding oxidoreductase [Paractinoplanes globisporus]|uniref:FAD-binding oxidoreductase n=1 Tax=Paractinoplanes globisporus TaxID=113565 RepID=A0ABW6W9U5_9ACTN|nr:FAD-binding oxidoreductase [Actinoplanes globisporus]
MRLDLTALRKSFRGTVVSSFDPGYEAARVLFNTRIRTRPAVLCRCADSQDVVTAMRFAREAGLPVAVRGGGHHASGLSLVDGGVVIDLGGLRTVALDREAAVVTAGAGAGWREIDRVTYAAGLAAPGGECPTVSNAGFSLGGGYGLLSRAFGLGCDHIAEAEFVDAGGRVLRVTEDEHPDLLWALRGAGGAGLGVVTNLRYRLDKVLATMVGGFISWPIDQASSVLRFYRDLYADRDDERLALCLLLSADPSPEISMYGLYIGPVGEAATALAPVRSFGKPSMDTFGEMSYLDMMHALGEEIPYGLQSRWRGGYFQDRGLDDAAIDIMLERFARVPSAYSMIRFDLLAGGAVARVRPDATAFVHRSALHYVSVISLWQEDAETAANMAWADDLADALRPHLTGEVYQNYADSSLEDWPSAYYGANYPRLQQIKQRYDPDDFFHHAQSIRLP